MRFIGAHLTVLKPLFDGTVLIPGIIACQGLFGWRVDILEDFVLAVEDGDGLNGLLIRVLRAGLLADFLLVLYVLMCLVDINMSSGKSLFKKERPLI